MAHEVPFYEKFLQKHFPAWGASREHARAKRTLGTVTATINEGIATRLTESFSNRLPLSMQSQEDRWNLSKMRDRGRKAYRGNPIARGMVNTELDNIVSHGMTLQAQTDSEEFNDESEDKFCAFMDTADIRGMKDGVQFQRSCWKESRVDGDGLIVLVSQGSGGNAVSKLQYVRGDNISTPDSKRGDLNILDGVEVDSFGRPTKFYVLYQDERGTRKWTPVAAQDAVYLCHPSEAYDVRGTTCYATVFDLLNNLEQYVDGVAMAAWMATVFGLTIKEESAGKQVAGLGSTTNSQGSQQKVITFENGQVKFMGKEGQVMQVDAKQPMQQTPDFVRIMLRMIGVPFDMPLELVLNDVSQSNLSSLRGGIQKFHRACKSKQCVYAGPNQWGKVYRWWVSREVNLQRFVSKVPEKYFEHEWMFHGWQFTDPLTDVQAALLEIDAGLNTRRNVLESLGRDPDTINPQLEQEKKDRDARGLADVASNMTRDRVEATEPDAPAAPAGDNNAAE